VVVLDVSPSMQKALGGGDQSRFEVALDSLKMLIEQKVSALMTLDDSCCTRATARWA